jgi:uncharacterized protein YndB with AHSA1/START domain
MNDTDIVRELLIDAAPETVFAHFTDPSLLTKWMGRLAWLDPRPGGLMRLDYNGFDIMRGEYVEVNPPTRLVFTWGWESLAGDDTPPGSSRVEATFTPEGRGTRLHIRHSGLAPVLVAPHVHGWDLFLPNLAAVATGGLSTVPAPVLSEPEELASRLNALLIRAVDLIECRSAAAWGVTVPGDGRSVAAVADHIGQHLGLVEFAAAVTRGERAPHADLGPADIDTFNAARALEASRLTAADVVGAIREMGPAAVTAIRSFDPGALERSESMRFAGGAHVDVRSLLLGPLLADIEGHVAALAATLG